MPFSPSSYSSLREETKFPHLRPTITTHFKMLPRQRKPPTPTAIAALPISVMAPRYTRIRNLTPAVLIPGDSVLESTTIGGTVTFFSIYQNVLIARILLSWFPGVQGSPLVRPLITVCDPYLSLFRRAVPPVFGLDLSPVLALFLLQALGSATAALGAEENPLPPLRRLRSNRIPLPWRRR